MHEELTGLQQRYQKPRAGIFATIDEALRLVLVPEEEKLVGQRERQVGLV